MFVKLWEKKKILEIAIKQFVCFQIKADPKATNSAKFHISSLSCSSFL